MKITFKIVSKVLFLVILFMMSPLFENLQISLYSINLFNQKENIQDLDLQNLNMMKFVKKEDIPKREMDTDKQNSVIAPPINDFQNKSIYIYSTHQKEEYKDQNGVFEASQILANLLIEKGYHVIVEKMNFTQELNRQKLNYNDSYLISRNALNDALADYGGFDLIIDFHRDSLPRNTTFTKINGKDYAKCMIVLGGLSSHFTEIQKKAMTLLDKTNQVQSGIMKSILVREAYYNQDMSENMLLIEVGSDENYYQEVLNSVEILAKAIDEMMREK